MEGRGVAEQRGSRSRGLSPQTTGLEDSRDGVRAEGRWWVIHRGIIEGRVCSQDILSWLGTEVTHKVAPDRTGALSEAAFGGIRGRASPRLEVRQALSAV